MLSNAAYAIDLVLEDEGGYVNNPNDNGGPTNKGVTLANFRRFIKPKGTIDDLKRLTLEQARDVYKQQYWNAVRADELPRGVDYCVFDFAVNSGPARAKEYLQRALAQMGLYKGAIDKKIGPATLAAANAADPKVLINTICDMRMNFLKRLADWTHFERGWSNRVLGVRRDSLHMVVPTIPKPVVVLPPVDETRPTTLWGWIVHLFNRRK